METIELKFILEGNLEIMKCNKNEYIKDILKKYTQKIKKDKKDLYFLLNGDIIKEQFKVNDYIENNDNEYKETILEILVFEYENNDEFEDKIKESKYIICPKCKEICLLNFDNYKITLNNCKNGHCFRNMLMNNFNDFQKINESKIICNKCKNNKLETTQNKFYKCCECNINLCPLCKSLHNKNHLILDYDNKDYYCNNHGERNIIYCKKCNKDLCDICFDGDHKNHDIIFLYKIAKNKDKISNELKNKIQKLKNENNICKSEKFNIVLDNLEIYDELINKLYDNFELQYKNYSILKNINNIFNYNKKVIKDIDIILNGNNIENKNNYISNIY